MTDSAPNRQLLTDLRDLIEIVDRRLALLRQHGSPEAVQQMESIREQMIALQAETSPETGPPEN